MIAIQHVLGVGEGVKLLASFKMFGSFILKGKMFGSFILKGTPGIPLLTGMLAYFLLTGAGGRSYKGHIHTQTCYDEKMCAVHLLDIYYNYLWLH